MALTWGLEKTSFYTLGCENLLALVDHKPLLGLLTSRNLGDIENPRLLHLAERLLKWRFTLKHIAGAKNHTPDALSRSPAPTTINQLCSLNYLDHYDQIKSDELEAQVLATTTSDKFIATSWDSVR